MKITKNKPAWVGATGACSFCNTKIELDEKDIPKEVTWDVNKVRYKSGDVSIIYRGMGISLADWDRVISEWVENIWDIDCPRCGREVCVSIRLND